MGLGHLSMKNLGIAGCHGFLKTMHFWKRRSIRWGAAVRIYRSLESESRAVDGSKRDADQGKSFADHLYSVNAMRGSRSLTQGHGSDMIPHTQEEHF